MIKKIHTWLESRPVWQRVIIGLVSIPLMFVAVIPAAIAVVGMGAFRVVLDSTDL